jgi:hypothetical protein
MFAFAATALARTPGPIQQPYEQLAVVADSIAKKESVERAHAWADSVYKAALARGDRGTQGAMLLWRGRRYAAHEYEYDKGAPFLAQALTAAHAQKDTFTIALIHARRGLGAQIVGRQESAKKDYAEAGALRAACRPERDRG